MYIIQRNDGRYVARAGQEHSYTAKLQEARVFTTRMEAEKDVCFENERVLPVMSAFTS